MVSNSQGQTEAAGKALAAQLRVGDVLLLRGELGAGKTVLVRGIAKGLGISEPVTSPTFTLMNLYEEGRLPLHHFDLYRLADADEFEAAGLGEYVSGRAVSLIEWPERAQDVLPACHLDIEIAYGEGESERLITLTPRGGFREVALP